ncbi:hypothetical protein [Ancylobacter radicis]|uniref:Uncharacterized protein n=1 Tax=Ancylobacter radicis TaxID=2836179 RepID=A0ABS5R1W5_9HYPH|nr:hypothetical protein [Ancylobacter radicis]MBS9475654.1 hypothetical protein [Ancylobacter radicis]
MANNDTTSNGTEKIPGASGAYQAVSGESFGSTRTTGSGASSTLAPRPVKSAAAMTEDAASGTGRRYSFNMLLATAVVGYAIGRLLPR